MNPRPITDALLYIAQCKTSQEQLYILPLESLGVFGTSCALVYIICESLIKKSRMYNISEQVHDQDAE